MHDERIGPVYGIAQQGSVDAECPQCGSAYVIPPVGLPWSWTCACGSTKINSNPQPHRDMLAKSQGRPPIPDGYVLVPRKPTEAMLKAGIYCDDMIDLGDDDVQMRSLRLIWSAMLDAAIRETPSAGSVSLF